MDERQAVDNFDAFPLTAMDKKILSMTDEEYPLTSWSELSDIICISFYTFPIPPFSYSDEEKAHNRLEELKRKPSDLRRYLAWSADTKAKYGSITNFVVQERLHWQPEPSDAQSGGPPVFEYESEVPFEYPEDFKILRNDWPYGLAHGITHLCIWTKTPIATDPATGDVTSESRSIIEDFVRETFSAPLDALFGEGQGKQNVLWFKNWVALQSVRGVDHIHVLLNDVPRHLIDDWTAE